MSSTEMNSPRHNLRYSGFNNINEKKPKLKSYVSDRSAFSPSNGRNLKDSLDTSKGYFNHGNML